MIKLFTIRGGKVNLFGITKSMVIAFLASGLVIAIAEYFKISEQDIWKFISLIQQQFHIEFGEDMNERFRNDEKLMDFIVKNKVDQALYDYQRLTGDDGRVKILPPRYIEKPVDETVCYSEECKKLGGEIRLCAPWVDNCVSEPVK